jgi:hypothetical protein
MIVYRLLAPLALLVLTLLCQSGCQPAAEPAAPEQALDSLRQSLDAWKQGERPEAFQERTEITAVERRWTQGVRLLAYEIKGEGRMHGFDWQVLVQLSLQNKLGKKMHERAIYNVSTSPARVVVRSES